MPTLLFGIVVLALVLWGLNAYSKADPKYLAKVLRPAGGILAVAAAAFLFFRGHLEVAIPLGLTGLGLLGWGPFASTGWFQRTQKTPGQVSRVRAPRIEMELDHDSGTMRGTILAGPLQGASLDDLDLATLLGSSPSSTPTAARYWRLILTAGSPAGVSTPRTVRRRGRDKDRAPPAAPK